MLKRIIIVGLFVFFQINSIGQSSVALKQADAYFQKEAYYNAILNYEIYLGLRYAPVVYSPYTNNKKKKLLEFSEVNVNNPTALKACYNLGQSYRALNDFQNAEKWYKLILRARRSKFPETKLWHATCLRALGHYSEAEKELKEFISDNADNAANAALLEIANNELNNINFIRQQVETRRPPAFALHKLKGNIDQIEGAYAPFVNDSSLVFTSARIIDTVNKFSKVNSHVNHLFTASISEKGDFVKGNASQIKFPSRTPLNEGTATFSPDGSMMYFTRWEETNGKLNSSIYSSKRRNDSTWEEPVKLIEKINQSGYNSNQPFVTDDGKYLLYASDRKDGLGKYDIWAATIDTGSNFGEPFNLSGINSKEDDKAPFYHTKTKTLVFSTNGRVGMGGFDLFYATGELASLQTPVNLGAPINSVKDDDYFFSASKDSLFKKAFVSSDRKSDCCLEIFSIEKLPKKIFKQKVDGLVSDCKTGNAIPNATVTINNEIDSTKNITLLTGPTGLFLVNLTDSTSGVTVKRKGYQDRSQTFRYDPDLYADTTYLIELCLQKAKKIKYKQHLEGTVVDCDTKKPISKAYITTLNALDSNSSVVLTTTAKGNFSVDLNDSITGLWFEKKAYFDKEVHLAPQSETLEGDTVYTRTYCMEKWKPDNSKEKGDHEKPFNEPNDTITDPRITIKKVDQINKMDSTVIHFDFNKAEIKPEAEEILDRLYAILKTYPTIALKLEISGHTDAIGTKEANHKLGQRRAIACLEYLLSKGISETQLKIISYDSTLPVAPEKINNKDDPEGRAKNRRAVLKVEAKLKSEKK